MARPIDQKRRGGILWAIARRQHGLVTRRQLLDQGLTSGAIHHRVKRGRLHPIRRGVYAVGSPRLDRAGHWMAAVLSCGPDAMLSHWSALALWGVDPRRESRLQVTVPSASGIRQAGLIVHRRPSLLENDRREHLGIPVTSVLRALFDVAPGLERSRLERLLGESDRLGFASSDELRSAVAAREGQRGAKALRSILDRTSYRRTDSELERRFLRIVRKAGIPLPDTQASIQGLRVDFYWPDLGLVVETDGLRSEVYSDPRRVSSELRRVAARRRADLPLPGRPA